MRNISITYSIIDSAFRDLESGIRATAKFYNNANAQKTLVDGIPLLSILQKALAKGDLPLCYEVLAKGRRIYESVLPYATGDAVNLTKGFIRETKELVDKKANANEVQAFLSNAVDGLKKATTKV